MGTTASACGSSRSCRTLRRSRALGASLLVVVLLLSAGLAGCGGSGSSASSETSPTGPLVVALGDSVTSGLGLPAEQSYPAQLQNLMDADGLDYTVVNAGVPGLGTTGGLRAIDDALEGDVRVVILALGGSDASFRVPVSELAANLAEMVERAEARGARVVLAGDEAPPSADPLYRQQMRDAYRELADRHRLPFIPVLTEGVGSQFQGDGVHPNAEGARIIAATVYAKVRPLLRGSAQKTRPGPSS